MLPTREINIQAINTDHFKSKFRDEAIDDIQPFSGHAKKLDNPITAKEVRESINRLNNGRAPGADNICNEYLKFAPSIMYDQNANILNKTFQ